MKRSLQCRFGRLFLYLGAPLAVFLGAGALSPGATATGALSYPPPILWGVSCPSTGLCVAIDDKGYAVISTDPTAGKPAWSRWWTRLVGAPEEISCSSISLCVAVDFNSVAISADPTAVAPTWSLPMHIDSTGGLNGVSCAGTSLCIAVDSTGHAVISTDPTAGTPTWSAVSIDTAALTGISCPSTSLCVAVDSTGHAVISTDPTAATPTWSLPMDIDNTGGLNGVSCADTSLCVAVDSTGHAVISTDPTAATPTWSAPAATGISSQPGPVGVSCPLTTFCLAGGGRAGVMLTDPSATTPMWSVVMGLESGSESPPGVSCASASLCVITYGTSARISTDPTAATPTWSASTNIDGLPDGTLSLRGSLDINGPTLGLQLDCSAESLFFQECSGAATLTTTERLAANGRTVTGITAATSTKHNRTVVVGRSTFAIGPNNKFTTNPPETAHGARNPHPIGVSLNDTGRRLLAKFKRLPVTLTLTAIAPEFRVPPTTITIKTVRVTLKVKATSRRKR